MTIQKQNSLINSPNFLLVAGNGRNVGKTWFVRKVIGHLSKSIPVTAVKVSSHFHPYNEKDVLIKNQHFILLEEKLINKKDSSLMLQAGAQKVFFLMASQSHLHEAFKELEKHLPKHEAIVCESGGLHGIITPGLFFFVNLKDKPLEKEYHLKYNPVLILNDGNSINFNIETIHFFKGSFNLAT